MRKLIVTRADDKVKEFTTLTHPILAKYANRCGADFKVITDDSVHPASHYRILQLYDILTEYNRVAVIDSDVIIKNTCPDLFDMVPYSHIGTILEDKGSRLNHRRSLIQEVQKQRGDVGWTEGYMNSGVFVVSDLHREIFNVDKENLWWGFGEDDVELGYQIHKNKFNIYELPWHMNCMSIHSEPEFGSKFRFNASILHYAGGGWFRMLMSPLEQLKQDLVLLTKLNMV